MCLAIPGEVLEIYEQNGVRMARVDFAGVKRAVCMQCVPECKIGEYVLVHVGFALSVIDAKEACRTLAMIDESELKQELGTERK